MPDSKLARYQSALLSLLTWEGLDLEERMRMLREHEVFAPYAEYVEGFDPHFVELSAVIAQKWAKPKRLTRKRG
ncbi:MAG TPA: hypothetical protein VGI39_26555 [Polyangiaceae bacterium]|jgi:hypothetical protein